MLTSDSGRLWVRSQSAFIFGKWCYEIGQSFAIAFGISGYVESISFADADCVLLYNDLSGNTSISGLAKEYSFGWFKCRWEMADLNTFIQSTFCNVLIYSLFINWVYPIWKRLVAVLLSEQSLEIRIEQMPRFRVVLKMNWNATEISFSLFEQISDFEIGKIHIRSHAHFTTIFCYDCVALAAFIAPF